MFFSNEEQSIMTKQRPKLVMMVPLRRCASNAIRLRMNLHPDFYSPYPLHLVDIMDALPQYGDLEQDENYFRLITDMVGLLGVSLVKWPDITFDPVDLMRSLLNKPRSIHMIYGEMLLQLGEKRGASVVMDKCQDSVCDYQELVRLFPDMLFLDVVRDPRAQICSMNKSIIYDFDTFLNTQRWVQSRKWVDAIHHEFPDKIMTIRYEDFVLQHEETMKRICGFMSLSFDPAVLDVSKSREAHAMSIRSPLWQTNFSGPDPQHIQKFLKDFSADEIEAIEHLCFPWMQKHGYPSMTPHQHGFPKTHIENARQIDQHNKELAWSSLHQKHPLDYTLRTARQRFIRTLVQDQNEDVLRSC